MTSKLYDITSALNILALMDEGVALEDALSTEEAIGEIEIDEEEGE